MKFRSFSLGPGLTLWLVSMNKMQPKWCCAISKLGLEKICSFSSVAQNTSSWDCPSQLRKTMCTLATWRGRERLSGQTIVAKVLHEWGPSECSGPASWLQLVLYYNHLGDWWYLEQKSNHPSSIWILAKTMVVVLNTTFWNTLLYSNRN